MRTEQLLKIFETEDWVDLAKYHEADTMNPNNDWRHEYGKLLEHHKNEREILLKTCKKLAKMVLDYKTWDGGE